MIKKKILATHIQSVAVLKKKKKRIESGTQCHSKGGCLSLDIKGRQKTRRAAASCVSGKIPVRLQRLKNCSSKGRDVKPLLSSENQNS